MAKERMLVTDHFVPHVSTVASLAGQNVRMFVREKVLDDGRPAQRPAVLMVHGGISHGTLAFDVRHKTYSWMDFLARAGFDVFAMDMTGYGQSPRPHMDDPNNVDGKQWADVQPNPTAKPGEPSYPFQLTTIQTECDEIDAVVNFIRRLRGAAKVNLLGWSGGGARTGFYTSWHGDKVERLVILAASNYLPDGPSTPPARLPVPGVPMTVQTRKVGEDLRWNPFIRCEGQLEPGLQDLIWKLMVESDPLGASWGPGVMRAPTRSYWGWNKEAAARIKVPTLIMVAEFDELMKANLALFDQLGASQKAFLHVTCGSHFVVWETQHSTVQEASREWLVAGTCGGKKQGRLTADVSGKIAPQ